MKDILQKKLSEVTVEELLAHLGLNSDLVRQHRELSQKAADEMLAMFDDIEDLKTYSAGPEKITNAAELMEWAVRKRKLFEHYPAQGHLLAIHAWIPNR